ncbi:IS110 family transposase [Petropleomorpha daqingensis]|uniref:Transposase n=1 Tax=Petropleomorpha daqingensis TaxID=2026353 RepID=A0A853CL66_9ACTN|nr:transposase [Petropleomorpha daqingensis]NYJ04922.1 transposase [Petropleomorpha daqingensis]NYJ06021.1 transposase [Petropleomorpha daqingensis]NYJ08814.1 transposase [Petropleomorpha daqingensis]
MGLLHEALPASTLVVAIDPGKVSNRVWLSTGEVGQVVPPLSLPVLRPGLEQLHRLVVDHVGPSGPVFAIEASGGLHQAWLRELNQRFPGSVRLFAPSETTAARAQLGSRRFKTDDRDCAALTYLARQGQGRPVPDQEQDALTAAVRHRRGLIGEHKVAQQRLHDQLHALCPGLAAPDGHGRALPADSVIGQAVLDCAAAFAGRPPSIRSLRARARGRVLTSEAEFWVGRWRACLPPPPDASARAARLSRSVARWRAIAADIAAVDAEITALLAESAGQILTTLPGVATSRAAAFAAFSLPIARFPTAEHLYSATGLAPGSYRSATINRRTPISRQGLPEHRDALMNLAWGLSQHCGPFIDRAHELRARGLRPIPVRIALARHACRLAYTLLQTQQPFDEQRYRRARHQSER